MRAMRVERADPASFVAEQDDLLAEELLLARQVAQFVRGADRLPITAHQFAHRAALLDAGQFIVGWRRLASIGRFHGLPPARIVTDDSAMQAPTTLACQPPAPHRAERAPS